MIDLILELERLNNLMDLKVKAIEVDPAAPFSRDRLSREKEIQNLTLLIRNLNTPAVIAVNSGWGTGKTTFIKMWAASLKLEGVSSLYFNAWSTDFSSDPLVAFLSEMNDGLKGLIAGSKRTQKAWAKTKRIGAQIAKRSLPALIKIGTAGVIDAEKIIEDETAKVLEALSGDALKAYEEHKSAVRTFKASLQTVVESSAVSPVVIFVDELDRCRPTYAINLLERIKHLFEVTGLIFVLALDRQQLGYSIQAIYGTGLDAQGYLRRFIDTDYSLKKPDIRAYITTLYDSFGMEKFFKARAEHSELRRDWEYLCDVFILLTQMYDFSLREIEQLLARVNLVLCATKKNQYIYPALLALLVVVREKNRGVYEDYLRKESGTAALIKYLYPLISEQDRLKSAECATLEGLIISAKINWRRPTHPELLRHEATFREESSSQESKEYASRVIAVTQHPTVMDKEINLENLAERIEMLTQFQFFGDRS